ncbi:hypothetical protein WA158_007675 [Blastocystis sp. Blastoise]
MEDSLDTLLGTEDSLAMDSQSTNNYVLLQRAMNNEKAAPEILHYDKDIIDQFLVKIKETQSILDDNQVSTIDESFESNLYQMDLDRCKYLVVNYLRIRLHKIETYAFYYIQESSMKNRMSNEEYEYLTKYVDIKGDYLHYNVVNSLPAEFQGLADTGNNDRDNMIPRPNLNVYVYVRVLEDIPNFVVGETIRQEFPLLKNNQYVLLYSDIRDYLEEKKVTLF